MIHTCFRYALIVLRPVYLLLASIYVQEADKSAVGQDKHQRRPTVVSVTVVNTARDLGVILDSQLSLDAHVPSVSRSSYYQLKQLRPVAQSLSVEAAKTLVQAFVSSRLDYCNAILHGLPEKLMRRLQSVQNAAARMITSARRRDHITPILRVCDSSTGYQYDSVSISRLPSWYSSV